MRNKTWVRLLAYVTGTVNQELLLRNEYLAAENRILRAKLPSRLRLSNPERATLAQAHKHRSAAVSFGRFLAERWSTPTNYLARIQADGSGLERLLDAPIAEKRAVSPDGEWVAVAGMLVGGNAPPGTVRGTFSVSTRDRSSRSICKGPCQVRWCSDGKYLCKRRMQNRPVNKRRVSGDSAGRN